ncbi:hypothetical protein KSD_85960 [Ktedonobacter sp. SOSP1-85]|uniref:hypothetical protein n=1 Tax=Ktedonobacter sp. SOSP1-85 TaxID=2778367 RepID=UPI001914DA82|nr:hypothetical protein [Ktedonobacter sp. SOSP1-85]GHO80825.1 hypothetical protein KSD_85960 [Ktedonobacter sp. SOSP1-85]
MSLNDPLLEHFYTLQPSRFTCLEHIRVYPGEEAEEGLLVEVVLYGLEPQSLRLLFHRVEQLNIQLQHGRNLAINHITSIKDHQWENLNYRISSEHGELSFYCRDFEASLV